MHDENGCTVCNYAVSDYSVFILHMNFFNHVGEHKQHSMKEHIIAVQLQSQMTCSCILHSPPATKHIKLNYNEMYTESAKL